MPATYTLISSNVLSSSAASVTFSAIPATYTDLVLRISARTGSSGTAVDRIQIQLAGISSSYSRTVLLGNGSAASSSRASSASYGLASGGEGSSATSNTFGNTEFYIPNYAGSANKVFSSFGVSETNATAAEISVMANLLSNTSAVNKIDLYSDDGSSFVSGSSFYLYGISNA
jgi:hypothetical protein